MSEPIAAVEAVEVRIRANLDDTEAWKVYADWLLDHGDPRGELIMLESLPGSSRDPRVQHAIAKLTAEHQSRWAPVSSLETRFEWRHGFVCGAIVGGIADRRDLRSLGRLLADPRARLLTSLGLRFATPRGPKSFTQLAEFELGGLSSFQAAYHQRGDAVVGALTRVPSLRLTTLDLRSAGLTDAGVIALSEFAGLRGLKTLQLQGNAFGSKGIAALAESPAMAELETLDLRFNDIGAEGAAALADSPVLARLAVLQLHAEDVGDEGIRQLGSSRTLPRDLVRFWRARETPR